MEMTKRWIFLGQAKYEYLHQYSLSFFYFNSNFPCISFLKKVDIAGCSDIEAIFIKNLNIVLSAMNDIKEAYLAQATYKNYVSLLKLIHYFADVTWGGQKIIYDIVIALLENMKKNGKKSRHQGNKKKWKNMQRSIELSILHYEAERSKLTKIRVIYFSTITESDFVFAMKGYAIEMQSDLRVHKDFKKIIKGKRNNIEEVDWSKGGEVQMIKDILKFLNQYASLEKDKNRDNKRVDKKDDSDNDDNEKDYEDVLDTFCLEGCSYIDCSNLESAIMSRQISSIGCVIKGRTDISVTRNIYTGKKLRSGENEIKSRFDLNRVLMVIEIKKSSAYVGNKKAAKRQQLLQLTTASQMSDYKIVAILTDMNNEWHFASEIDTKKKIIIKQIHCNNLVLGIAFLNIIIDIIHKSKNIEDWKKNIETLFEKYGTR
jgi:hypothetical protein